jgi:DnaJ-class molecular chaperone
LNEEFSKPKRNLDYLGFYEVLGLDPTDFVTQHDIKQNFYKRVIRYHPDKHKESKDKIEAKKLFQQLIRAYEVLKHPDTRKEYDAGDYKE